MGFFVGLILIVGGAITLRNELARFRKNRQEVIVDNVVRILGEYFLEYAFSRFLWGAGAVLIGIALIIVFIIEGAA